MENFREIESMLSFLDDADADIRKQIRKNLEDMLSNNPETFFEVFNKFKMHSSVFENLSDILLSKYAVLLSKWRKEKYGKNLLEGWYLITMLMRNFVSYKDIENSISRFANILWLRTNNVRYIKTKVERFYKMLLEKDNFTLDGGCSLFLTPECISMRSVFIDKKIGGLGFIMLFYLVFQKLGIDSQIVKNKNFYFLRFVSHNENFYLSSLPGDLIIEKSRIENNEDEFSDLVKAKPLSHIYVVLEIIDRLIFYYTRRGDRLEENFWKKVSEIIEIKR